MISKSLNLNPGSRVCILVLTFVFGVSSPLFAQGPEDYNDEIEIYSNKGFHAGLYLGAYFSGDQSASLYDGYGYNLDGEKNSFLQSWLFEKINLVYGGYGNNGAPDYVAEALGVQHGDWKFDSEEYMPFNMKYKTAYSVGFTGRYSVDGNNGIIVNVTAVILKAAGNFIIETRPPPGSTQINNSLFTGNISGEEQRLNMEVGYEGMLGEPGGMRFIVEGGLHATLAKFVNNEAQINDLIINLSDEYYDPINGYTFFTGSKPVALGFGAFAGLGLHFETSSQWNLQIMYNPILDNVRIGFDPKLTLSHAAGIRLFYKLKKERVNVEDY